MITKCTGRPFDAEITTAAVAASERYTPAATATGSASAGEEGLSGNGHAAAA